MSDAAASTTLTLGAAHKNVSLKPKNEADASSVLGLWEPQRSFEYGLVIGGFNSERYVSLMNWQAERAAAPFATTGQLSVVIQDGASSQ